VRWRGEIKRKSSTRGALGALFIQFVTRTTVGDGVEDWEQRNGGMKLSTYAKEPRKDVRMSRTMDVLGLESTDPIVRRAGRPETTEGVHIYTGQRQRSALTT
jgi:hypothetical protein